MTRMSDDQRQPPAWVAWPVYIAWTVVRVAVWLLVAAVCAPFVAFAVLVGWRAGLVGQITLVAVAVLVAGVIWVKVSDALARCRARRS